MLSEICLSINDLYDPILPEAFKKQAEKYLNKGLPNTYEISIIESDSRGIGFIGYTDITESTRYLIAFYLHSAYQRKGIGEQILNTLVNLLETDNYEEIVLLVHKKATWAINFYLKNDFEILGKSKEKIQDYKNGILNKYYIRDTILMGKRLRAQNSDT